MIIVIAGDGSFLHAIVIRLGLAGDGSFLHAILMDIVVLETFFLHAFGYVDELARDVFPLCP